MFEIIKVIILGVIEGVTEWLPISSTGHLILADEFLKLAQAPEFIEVFTVVIQLGAVLAVLSLYLNKLNPFQYKLHSKEFNQIIDLWKKILVACVPAAIIGILFDDIIDEYLFNPNVVALALIIYGVAFLIVERRKWKPKVKSLQEITYREALKIGSFQVLALVPGTSRSGATILGGLISGVERTTTTEFSFFLALPVMLGASLLKFVKLGFQFTAQEWGLLGLGSLVSFIVSILAIRFLLNYVKKNDFKLFGWYRIVLGLIVLAYFLIK
ncbi:MAG: undecaprenyl-diphosphate phosphatase [Candidatus Nanosyncoccaceae bacterium]|jgi:undecaprenyl-diphosphatase